MRDVTDQRFESFMQNARARLEEGSYEEALASAEEAIAAARSARLRAPPPPTSDARRTASETISQAIPSFLHATAEAKSRRMQHLVVVETTVLDIERGQLAEIRDLFWQTDAAPFKRKGAKNVNLFYTSKAVHQSHKF